MTDIARATDTREIACQAGTTVELLLSNADIRVRATDLERVVVRTRDGRPVDDEIRVDSEPGRIRIRDGEDTFRLGPIVVRLRGTPPLDIEVPRTARIACRTMSGDVTAEGIGAASRWSSASGDIRIAAAAGPIAIDTMSGDAVVEASAPVGLDLRTVSGDVRIRAPRVDSLAASTTSGDVHLAADLAVGVRHTLSSVSGDVEVETASGVRVDTQTVAGDVLAAGIHRVEGGRGSRTVVLGDGAATLSVRTTSGDIHLRSLTVAGPVTAAAPRAPEAPRPPVVPEAPAPPVAPVPEPVVLAEAEAAPNLVRDQPPSFSAPSPAAAPEAWAPAGPGPVAGEEGLADRREAARLEVLRALERGDLDVATASARLEILEDAGPRAFRGWC